MKSLLLAIILAVLLITSVLPLASPASAETLSGTVVNGTNRPIPGLNVYLVDSVSNGLLSVTDTFGRYSFVNAPPGQYSLEVYWGTTLLYRNSLFVRGNTAFPTIVLY